jgi:glucose-6-phosphate dehydrogenase assembly protein OpcA
MAPDSFTVSLAGNEVSLSPEQIERELSSMWKPLNEAEGASVTRMVLGNVVWVGETGELPRFQRIVQKVVPRHPCRLFVLEFDRNDTGDVPRATINAQCFRPKAGGVPVCCEMIHYTFGPAAMRHVRGCVAPLLLGDLQTILWQSIRDEDCPVLGQLQELADRTILMEMRADSSAEHLRRCLADIVPAFDLCWFRTLPLRQQMTSFFDDSANHFDLRTIQSVELITSRRAAFPQLPLFVGSLVTGWLASRLDWKTTQAAPPNCRFQSPGGVVDVAVVECDEEVEAGSSGFRGLILRDEAGRTLRLTVGSRELQFCLHVTAPDGTLETSRQSATREMRGWESLGRALSAPPPVEDFRKAARLAIPILETN